MISIIVVDYLVERLKQVSPASTASGTRAPPYSSPATSTKIVSEMFGNSSTSIALETYSHMLPTLQESAIHALEDTLE